MEADWIEEYLEWIDYNPVTIEDDNKFVSQKIPVINLLDDVLQG